jgi:hypothetical protein
MVQYLDKGMLQTVTETIVPTVDTGLPYGLIL